MSVSMRPLAFPVVLTEDGVDYLAYTGLEMRDYFAGLVLQGILASKIEAYSSASELADDAYLLADKMMAARNKDKNREGSNEVEGT